jgi:hypothetical protein
MFRNFASTPTSATTWQTVVEAFPCAAGLDEYSPAGWAGQEDVNPRPFVIQLQGARPDATAGAYSGAHVRITSYLGEPREILIYLGTEARVWTSVTKGVKVEVRLENAANPATIRGAVSWGGPYLPAQPRDVSSLAQRRALSFAQATADGAILGFSATAQATISQACDLVELTCNELTGGAAMVPVTLYLAGVRISDGAIVPLGSVTISPAVATVNGGAYARFPIIPFEFSAIQYQVIGFPALNGGAATFQIMASGRG